ncbi:MAG: putative DNA binding domain-containing protein, partial [Candidatus Omnitrophica bacterium]|nr:putative DNA binding domain-containing protein [Candidatus Omnitrophota bacterium]
MSMKESETIEFKESLTQLKKGVISIVSILNKHNHGKLFFGITDTGSVKGVSIGKNTLRDISKTISDYIEPTIYPEIKEEIIEGKKCVVIEFEGENVPYFAYGRTYKRIADEDRPLSKSELEKLILENNKDKLLWDSKTDNKFALTDISESKLKSYVKDAGLKYTSKKEALEKLELIRDNKLTNASIVLFGKDPPQFFGLLTLRCATFLGENKASTPLDMTDFNGDLFELISHAENYILQHINVGMRLEGLYRIDVPEINKDAFREAIINAFCHRDYSIPQEVQIAIFRNKVEILNPGRLYAGLSIKDILSKPISERRNPLIADIFH